MTLDPELLFTGMAHLVPDLEAAVAQYQALGFSLVGPHAGPSNTGIRTAAWFTRRCEYIEAVGVQDRTLAQAAYPDWATMERMQQAGGGDGRFHLLVADVPAVVDQLRTRGVPVAGPVGRSAALPTGETVTYTTARVMAGRPWDPFFLNYGEPPRDSVARRQAQGLPASPWTISLLVVETARPEADAAWLAEVLDTTITPLTGTRWQLAIPGCTLVFTAGSAGRITEVVLNGAGAPEGEVAGLRYQSASAPD